MSLTPESAAEKQRWNPSAPMEGHLAPKAEGNGQRTSANENEPQGQTPAAFRPSCCRPSPMWAEASEYGLPAGLVSLLTHRQWLHPNTQHSAPQDLM